MIFLLKLFQLWSLQLFQLAPIPFDILSSIFFFFFSPSLLFGTTKRSNLVLSISHLPSWNQPFLQAALVLFIGEWY